jgi:hypothetical protein
MPHIVLDAVNNEARYVDGITRDWVDLDNFFNIHENNEIDSGLLPRGCIAYKSSKYGTSYLIEQPPIIRSLKWQISREMGSDNKKAGEYKIIRLSMPYVLHYLSFDGLKLRSSYCFFSNKPVSDFKSLDLRQATLPNIHGSGEVCTGISVDKIVREELLKKNNFKSAYDLWDARSYEHACVNAYLSTFWNTTFNMDMGQDSYYAYKIIRYDDWENLTQKNPEQILDVNWHPSSMNSSVRDSFLSVNPPKANIANIRSLQRFIVATGRNE